MNTPSPKKNREKAERGERKKKRPKKTEHLLKTEGTKESKSVENKRKIIEKKNSEKMLQQSKIKLENTKSAKFADKIVKFEGKNKPKDQENVKENKLAKSQAIPRDSKIKFNQTDSQPASPSPSPSPSDDGRPKKKSKLLSGLTNSPGSTRKRSLSLAFGTFKSKKSLLTPAVRIFPLLPLLFAFPSFFFPFFFCISPFSFPFFLPFSFPLFLLLLLPFSNPFLCYLVSSFVSPFSSPLPPSICLYPSPLFLFHLYLYHKRCRFSPVSSPLPLSLSSPSGQSSIGFFLHFCLWLDFFPRIFIKVK